MVCNTNSNAEQMD